MKLCAKNKHESRLAFGQKERKEKKRKEKKSKVPWSTCPFHRRLDSNEVGIELK